MKNYSTLAPIAVIFSLFAPLIASAQGYVPPAPKLVLSCDGLTLSSFYDGGFTVVISDKTAESAITQTITSMSSFMQEASQPFTSVTLSQTPGGPVYVYFSSGSGGATGSYYVSPGASEANFMQKTALYATQQNGVSGMSLRISTSTNVGTRDSDVNWQPLTSEIFFKNCQNAPSAQ